MARTFAFVHSTARAPPWTRTTMTGVPVATIAYRDSMIQTELSSHVSKRNLDGLAAPGAVDVRMSPCCNQRRTHAPPAATPSHLNKHLLLPRQRDIDTVVALRLVNAMVRWRWAVIRAEAHDDDCYRSTLGRIDCVWEPHCGLARNGDVSGGI